MPWATQTTATVFGNRGYLIVVSRWVLTLDTIFCLIEQKVSTLLINYHQDVFYNT